MVVVEVVVVVVVEVVVLPQSWHAGQLSCSVAPLWSTNDDTVSAPNTSPTFRLIEHDVCRSIVCDAPPPLTVHVISAPDTGTDTAPPSATCSAAPPLQLTLAGVADTVLPVAEAFPFCWLDTAAAPPEYSSTSVESLALAEDRLARLLPPAGAVLSPHTSHSGQSARDA